MYKRQEYYLANFDSSKDAESGLTNKIRTGWNQLDLSGLGDSVCTVAINFEGSDSSAYGLNTPAYVAIDDIDAVSYTHLILPVPLRDSLPPGNTGHHRRHTEFSNLLII